MFGKELSPGELTKTFISPLVIRGVFRDDTEVTTGHRNGCSLRFSWQKL